MYIYIICETANCFNILTLIFQHRLHDIAIIAHKIPELTGMVPIKSHSVYSAIQNYYISFKKLYYLTISILSTIILSAEFVSICDQFFETNREKKKSSYGTFVVTEIM